MKTTILGIGCIVVGVLAVLGWWPSVMVFLKGVAGFIFILTGAGIILINR